MGRGGDLLAMAPILTMYLEVGGCVLDAMLLAQPQAGIDTVGVVRLVRDRVRGRSARGDPIGVVVSPLGVVRLQVEVVEDIVRL